MDSGSYSVKHRDSKLRAQVKWLEEEDYDFLDFDNPNKDFVEYKPPERKTRNTSTGTNAGRTIGGKPKFEEGDCSFSDDQSHLSYSKSSTLTNTSEGTPVGVQRKRYIQDTPNRNKVVAADTGKFAAFLQKWNNHLPILRFFNENVQPINYNYSFPKLISCVDNGETVVDVKFKLSLLFNSLTCKLCKGLLFNAHTIKSCFHTFCKSCIILYAILVGQQCPICRQHLNTNLEESIEYDTSIQGLVDKLFPLNNEDINCENNEGNEIICKNEKIDPLISGNSAKNDNYVKADDFSFINYMKVSSDYNSFLRDGTAEAIEIENSIYDKNRASEKRCNESISKIKTCITLTSLDSGIGKEYYIAVEKEMFISDLIDYLLLKLQMYGECSIFIYLENELLPKNHTIEFICKSRRINMYQNIDLKYSIRRINKS